MLKTKNTVTTQNLVKTQLANKELAGHQFKKGAGNPLQSVA